jgi:hypothetical protein
MYESPSTLELARQRHKDVLAETGRERLARQGRQHGDRPARIAAVRAAFAGLVAAVTGTAHPRRAPRDAGVTPTV